MCDLPEQNDFELSIHKSYKYCREEPVQYTEFCSIIIGAPELACSKLARSYK